MRPLILPGLVLLAALGSAARIDAPIARYPWLLALLAAAAGAWLLAARSAARAPGSRGATALVFAVAVLARLFWLAPAEPLSDDLYRYLWDGRVANAGIDPFAFPPLAPELAALRDEEVWRRVNHPDVPTIYPPVAQLLFRSVDAVAPTPRGMRAAASTLDLATMAALALLLRARRRPAAGALILGWCPLSVLESAGGGHVDCLGAALLVFGLLALEVSSRARAAAGGLLLGLSALVKPVALVVLPALLARSRPVRRPAFLAGAAAALLVALPYAGAGSQLFAGLLAYGERWRFNDAFYSPLVAAGIPPLGARAALAFAVVLVAAGAPRLLRDPLAAAGCVVGAGIALSPTVHPWYALWIVPLLPFLPRAVAPAAFALVTLLPVSYAASWLRATTGVWAEPAWSRPVLWVPVLALLAFGLIASRTRAAVAAPRGESS